MTTQNPQVGTVNCPFHFIGQQVQARVKKSVTKSRYYIHCPACGLIQPTLPSFQRWISEHATFTETKPEAEKTEQQPVSSPSVEAVPDEVKTERKKSDLEAWGL